MCGLVGVAGNLDYKDVRAFKQMLIADTFRGSHSTGVASIKLNKELEPAVLKQAVPAWDFVELKSFDNVASISAQILMGHNRHATKGEINKANAHPFYVEDSLVGTHNGTINISQSPFISDAKDFGTDSEAVLSSFAKRGELETLSNIVGAWAFVWYDYEKNTLNFTRNSERPLFIAHDDKNSPSKLFWSSESGLLRWILNRNDIKYEGIVQLRELELVSFKVPNSLKGKFELEKVKRYKEKTPERVLYPVVPVSYSRKIDTKPSRVLSTKDQPTLEVFKPINTIKQILHPEWYDPKDKKSFWIHTDDRGEILADAEKLVNFTKNCDCSICGSRIEPEERWRVFPHKVFVCEFCAESEEAEKILFDAGVVYA